MLTFLFALTSLALAIDSPAPILPETVVIPSGKLRLKAFLWKPSGPGPFPAVLFCHGSGGADADHTAGLPITEAAWKLAPLFLKHGYAFLYLFRRGQGLSADQGPFMRDTLQRKEATNGKQARQHLQFMLLTTDHLDSVVPESCARNRCQAYCDCRPLVWRSASTTRRGAGEHRSCRGDVRSGGRIVGGVA
jgi:hypothetical protein